MPARKQPGLIFLWSSGTQWSGNQSYTAVPKSTSQITCALWPLPARDAAKGLSDMSPWAYCCESLQTRIKARKEQDRQLSKRCTVSRVVTAWKSFHRILWLKQEAWERRSPPTLTLPPHSQQQRAEPEETCYNLQPFLKMCDAKIRHYIEVLQPLFSHLYWDHTLLSHGLDFWEKSTVGNSALSWCKYISLW